MGVDAEALCELEEVPDRGVALSPFNSADIGTVQTGTVSERFLGKARIHSEAP